MRKEELSTVPRLPAYKAIDDDYPLAVELGSGAVRDIIPHSGEVESVISEDHPNQSKSHQPQAKKGSYQPQCAVRVHLKIDQYGPN